MGAEKIAASLYLEATAAHQQADGFVQLNPYEEARINELFDTFTFSANHLLHVTTETVALQEMDKKSLAAVILRQEEQLQHIGKGLGSQDVRDQSLENQAALLAKKAMELAAKAGEVERLGGELEQAAKVKTELDNAKTRIAELEKQLAAKEVEVEQLQTQMERLNASQEAEKEDNTQAEELLLR